LKKNHEKLNINNSVLDCDYVASTDKIAEISLPGRWLVYETGQVFQIDSLDNRKKTKLYGSSK